MAKRLRPLLATAVLFTLLAACSSAQPAAQPTAERFLIGMSQANNAEPWRAAMNAQIAAAARKLPELEVRFADAAQNNATQVADVERFIEEGVDLLIISPNEATPLTNVVARAYDKGIPVIVLDRKVNGDKYTMWIGADNKLIGRRAGAYAAQWCKDQGRAPCNVIELRGLEGSTPATERGDGFREGIATNSAVKIIASQNADWIGDKAIPLAVAMLKVNPQVDVIYAHNDPMAEGALKAFQKLSADPSATLIIGIDALPTPDGGLKSVIDSRLDVTYVYPTGGQEAIEWAVKILEQKAQPPKEVILDTLEVVPANAADLLKSFGGE
ncbi:MAG: substrate-binding domain-containing protein [Chloroflexales bacterium]|nr:substrate-binding domain-containing protein [Chloroflexales bacterium]